MAWFLFCAIFVIIYGLICTSKSSYRLAANNNKNLYSSPLNLSVISWNTAEKTPTDVDCSFFRSYRNNDFVVFGIQECENIKPRRNEGHRPRKWAELQSKYLGKSFICIARHKMGGLLLSVYANKKSSYLIDGIQILDVACGVANILGNKGAVSIVLRLKGKTLVLVNSHFAAHQLKVQYRNDNYLRILNDITEKVHKKWLFSINTKKASILSRLDKNDGISTENSDKTTRKSVRSAEIVAASLPDDFDHDDSTRYRKDKNSNHVIKNRGSKVQSPPSSSTIAIRPAAAQIPFDMVVFFGDLNYRIELSRNKIERFHSKYKRYLSLDESTSTTTSSNKNTKYDNRQRKIRSNGGSTNGMNQKSSSRLMKSSKDEQKDILTLEDMKLKLSNRYTKYAPTYLQSRIQNSLNNVFIGKYDQLHREKNRGEIFQRFHEGRIDFAPTYKYDVGTDSFDTSKKQRCPAWTDRILYYSRRSSSRNSPSLATTLLNPKPGYHSDSNNQVCSVKDEDITNTTSSGSNNSTTMRLLDYYSLDVRTSDHRPVCADFEINLF